jgi:hypothetical protein
MTKGIVKPFEMINIGHDDPNLFSLAFSPPQFPVHGFFQSKSVFNGWI